MSESQPLLNREGQGGALSWADRFGLLLMLRKRMAVSHPYTLRDQEMDTGKDLYVAEAGEEKSRHNRHKTGGLWVLPLSKISSEMQ